MVNFKNQKKAFTLIELMVAIAIVAIMAAIVMVNLSGYASEARSNKALAEMASALPFMISCWGNGGDVKAPASGGDICSLASSYGKWPVNTSGDLTNYNYTSSAAGGKLDRSSWFISFSSDSNHDNHRICCTSSLNNCENVRPSVTCSP